MKELSIDYKLADHLNRSAGTPFYLYNLPIIKDRIDFFRNRIVKYRGEMFFSVKSLNNLSMLKEIANLGSGFDTVSVGEIFKVRQIQTKNSNVVFAGVGKRDDEISYAVKNGVGYITVESIEELKELQSVIQNNRDADTQILLRINPGVSDSSTPKKTSTGHGDAKFGIDIEELKNSLAEFHQDTISRIKGIHFHIGSPIRSPSIYHNAIDICCDVNSQILDNKSEVLNIGGGFPAFDDPLINDYDEYFSSILKHVELRFQTTSFCKLFIEPGRSIVSHAGYLVSKVIRKKKVGKNQFVIIDAGMNDFQRIAVYGAQHTFQTIGQSVRPNGLTHIVGPVCESTDVFATDYQMEIPETGDYVMIKNAGAYGMTMASQYNARPRPAEILWDGINYTLIRHKEKLDDLLNNELTDGLII